MSKLKAKVFKGIYYIHLDELPVNSRDSLLEWIDPHRLISIKLSNEKILTNCIQYSEYEYWFDNIFKKPGQPLENKPARGIKKYFGFAYNNG